MSEYETPRRMSRRTFLLGLVGVAGMGAASWSLGRASAGSAASTPATSAPSSITSLPPVAAVTPPPAVAVGATEGARVGEAPAAMRSIPVLCREAWGAEPHGAGMVPHVPVRLTVHHTGSVLSSDAAAPSYVRDHQAFHQQGRGWADIAYHFVVDATGTVYEGRPVGLIGDTGTEYDPTGHLLIVCEGNFDRHALPDAQRNALVDLLAWGSGTYGIDPGTISGHRDWAATACPGASLYAVVDDGSLAAAVRGRLADGGVAMDLQCGLDAAARVAAIEASGDAPFPAISWEDRGVE